MHDEKFDEVQFHAEQFHEEYSDECRIIKEQSMDQRSIKAQVCFDTTEINIDTRQ